MSMQFKSKQFYLNNLRMKKIINCLCLIALAGFLHLSVKYIVTNSNA